MLVILILVIVGIFVEKLVIELVKGVEMVMLIIIIIGVLLVICGLI